MIGRTRSTCASADSRAVSGVRLHAGPSPGPRRGGEYRRALPFAVGKPMLQRTIAIVATGDGSEGAHHAIDRTAPDLHRRRRARLAAAKALAGFAGRRLVRGVHRGRARSSARRARCRFRCGQRRQRRRGQRGAAGLRPDRGPRRGEGSARAVLETHEPVGGFSAEGLVRLAAGRRAVHEFAVAVSVQSVQPRSVARRARGGDRLRRAARQGAAEAPDRRDPRARRQAQDFRALPS